MGYRVVCFLIIIISLSFFFCILFVVINCCISFFFRGGVLSEAAGVFLCSRWGCHYCSAFEWRVFGVTGLVWCQQPHEVCAGVQLASLFKKPLPLVVIFVYLLCLLLPFRSDEIKLKFCRLLTPLAYLLGTESARP